MINVNTGQLQGDAHLVTIGGTVVVIDAGYYSEARSSLLPYFRDLGIQKIDHFFVSHPHKDHYEGLVAFRLVIYTLEFHHGIFVTEKFPGVAI